LLPLVQAEADGKSGHVLLYFYPRGKRGVDRRILCRNHGSVESLGQDFLSLWKDADRDIPILQKAKAEYARLQ
ncbi:MAG TPA: hypothetical protein VNY05_08200, partial [Candidatus Acidoferrales bacterium]|nr:hypothetical protein [Candidatus Acidoferrales bacterium]